MSEFRWFMSSRVLTSVIGAQDPCLPDGEMQIAIPPIAQHVETCFNHCQDPPFPLRFFSTGEMRSPKPHNPQNPHDPKPPNPHTPNLQDPKPYSLNLRQKPKRLETPKTLKKLSKSAKLRRSRVPQAPAPETLNLLP